MLAASLHKILLFSLCLGFPLLSIASENLSTFKVSSQLSLTLSLEKAATETIYSIHLEPKEGEKRLLWQDSSLPHTGLHIAAAWVDESDATILISVPLAMAVLVRVKDPYSETPSATTSLEDGIFHGSGITAETLVKFTSANSFVMTEGGGTSIPVEIQPNGELYTQGQPLPKPQRNVIHIQKSTNATQAISSLSGQPLPPQNASEPKPGLTTVSAINEEAPISSALWGVIIVVIAAAVGLLWLLIGKR